MIEQKDAEKDQQSPKEGKTSDLPLQSMGEAKLEYLSKPPEAPEGKQIHPRRPLPPLPEGDDEANANSSLP